VMSFWFYDLHLDRLSSHRSHIVFAPLLLK
jgi:hypothetical protein